MSETAYLQAMEMAMKTKKDDEFKISKSESDQLKKAFKKPEFRKMFAEYLEEISDPKNRREYEEAECSDHFTGYLSHASPAETGTCLWNRSKDMPNHSIQLELDKR